MGKYEDLMFDLDMGNAKEFCEGLKAMIDERVKARVATLRVAPCGCLHKVVGSRLERRGPSSIAGCTDCGGSGYVLEISKRA